MRRMAMNRPIIGITMGDPYGSGADISVKALADKSIYDRCRPLVVGDACCMEYAAEVAERYPESKCALIRCEAQMKRNSSME